MKVKALINYKDLELKRSIKLGEEFEVSEERAEVLLKGNSSSGNKPFVKVIEEPKLKEPKKKEPKAKKADEIKEE